MVVPAFLVASNASEAHAQSYRFWIGENTSWSAQRFIICIPQCVPAWESSNRPVRATAVGVERRFRDNGYSHVSAGATLARLGYAASTPNLTSLYLSVPVIGVVEPFGPAARLGLGVGAGLSGDLRLERVTDPLVSLTGGAWLIVPLSRVRLTAGLRGSRAITRRVYYGGYLRSRVLFVGIESAPRT